MTRRAVAIAAGVVLTASLGAMVWAAATGADVVAPLRDALPRGLTQRAAAAAAGQRLLVIEAKRGLDPKATVYETASGPSGWEAYPASPDPGDPLLAALANLGAAAATEQARDGRLAEPTVRALGRFGVAVVAVHDGTSIVPPEVGERDPHLGIVPDVPAVRVRHANSVFVFLSEERGIDAADAIGFARASVLDQGANRFLHYEDYAPWGGGVTIHADTAASYLLTYSAAGARVTVDGAPAAFRPSHAGMILIDLPKGRHEVSVRYGPDRTARDWTLVALAALAVASFVTLWLLLRPTPAPAS